MVQFTEETFQKTNRFRPDGGTVLLHEATNRSDVLIIIMITTIITIMIIMMMTINFKKAADASKYKIINNLKRSSRCVRTFVGHFSQIFKLLLLLFGEHC